MDPAELHQIAAGAMRARGLLPEFSDQALREAEAARGSAPALDGDVRDLRALHWFSIDNEDTQDLDQLSFAEALPGGVVRLRVAVADVEASVPAGGAMDEHAGANTTSVYTAARVFPMLPEALSTDRTSLHAGQERLAVVVEMDVQEDGTAAAARLYRAAVLNHSRLHYGEVAAWLDGAGGPAALETDAVLQEQLRLHDTVAGRLRRWRARRGALDMGTVAARPMFRAGQLVDLVADTRNRAKELIADLMIAANAATARFLAERGLPSLRRVLQAPRRWDRIVALAQAHGALLPAEADAQALDRFLHARRAADPEGFADLSLAVVKLLGAGEYAAVAPGVTGVSHFGLAVNDYTHSTAPNRRFIDLVTQRLVKAALAQTEPPYAMDDLQAIARRCSLQEGNAAKVERQVLKAAAAFLLHGRVGERFHAVVTGAASKGTFVRIAAPLVEGRLVRGFEGLDVGDCLQVRLVGVDAAQGFIDFERS